MKRLSMLMMGAVMLSASVFTSVLPAEANSARPALRGTYTVLANYNGSPGYMPFQLTLNRNHTGNDSFGDSVTWSLSGANFQMVLTGAGGSATFIGIKNRFGFSKLAKPGTIIGPAGPAGVWYAIKQ